MIVVALLGDSFSYPQTAYFTDVPAGNQYFKYVQKLKELGITAGCSLTTFCPDDNIKRGEMATFIIRTKLRASNSDLVQPPYPMLPFFQDVAGSHIFFPYIQKLKHLGLTSGCTPTSFCPEDLTSRGALAAFISRTLYAP
jgi:hypothetical protein